MYLGGFPHKCQLAAKGISVSQGRAGGAAARLCLECLCAAEEPNTLTIFSRFFYAVSASSGSSQEHQQLGESEGTTELAAL